MTARFFDHLLAGARGQLGPSRVRPQAVPRWAALEGEPAPEVPTTEAAPAAASDGPGARGEPPASRPSAQPPAAPAAPRQAQAAAVAPPAAVSARPAAPPSPLQAGEPLVSRMPPVARPAGPLADAAARLPPPRLQPEASSPSQAHPADEATPDPAAALPAAAPPHLRDARPSGHLARRSGATQVAAAHDDSTVVHVSIGRVELFAPPAPPAVRAPRTAPRGGSVPLADYLRGKPR